MSFESEFDCPPLVTCDAPGRVNLLGEHTDYSGGFVLPIGIKQFTRVELAPSSDGLFHLHSVNLQERVTFAQGDSQVLGFGRYVHGCIEVLGQTGHRVPPALIQIDSTVPIGVGLSSSASLEIGVLRALRQWLSLELNDVDLAQLAQKAEIEYAGVTCGIMDQMASSVGDQEHMIFLDTRSLEHQRLPLPAHSEVLIVDTNTPRQLAGSAYNTRRLECEAAARLLGVNSLRDVEDIHTIQRLPSVLQNRARHVVSENLRVLKAITADAQQFGILMNESHRSLRDDYEVSSPALDALASSLQQEPSVFGARLTGAGFGGACVALAHKRQGAQAGAAALRHFANLGFEGGRLLS